jgi:hypothetical protein
VTLTGAVRVEGGGSSPTLSDPTPSTKRKRWWPFLLAGAVAAALVVSGVLAATYQPLEFGGAYGGAFAGLPVGSLPRFVNTLAGQSYYIPPQRTVFTIVESIENSGPKAVTIEAVSVVVPPSQGISPWPLRPAGQARYMPEYNNDYTKSGLPVQGLSLGPGQSVRVGIPVKMAGDCYVRGSGVGVTVFYVEERFLVFTQWVALPVGTPLFMHEPEPKDAGSDLVCPK